MKSLLKNLLCLVIALGCVGGYGYYRYTNLRKETIGYTTEAINAIAGTWNPDEVTSRWHPSLKAFFRDSPKSLSDYFRIYSELGRFVRIHKCDLALNTASLIGSTDDYKSADYDCSAEFGKSDATIKISIRKDDPDRSGDDEESWQITKFTVSSPLFARLSTQ